MCWTYNFKLKFAAPDKNTNSEHVNNDIFC